MIHSKMSLIDITFKNSLTFLESNFQLYDQISILQTALLNSNCSIIHNQLILFSTFFRTNELEFDDLIESNIISQLVQFIANDISEIDKEYTTAKKVAFSFLTLIVQKSKKNRSIFN